MIQTIAGVKIALFVPSSNRWGNVAELTRLLAPLRPTWLVPDDQAAHYAAQLGEDPQAGRVLGGGSSTSIACARNCALDLAFADGAYCLMVDDDLRKLGRAITSLDGLKRVDVTADGFFAALVNEARNTDFHLVGPNTTDNAYFVHKTYASRLFISTACSLSKPGPLRFDERFKVREDYDYVCQHIQRYGGALRVNTLLPTFRYKVNTGGCQHVRTPEVEAAAIRLLMEKWPGWIRRNPRREGEVLLKVPKMRRAAL